MCVIYNMYKIYIPLRVPGSGKHTHTHTHTYIYIYIYIYKFCIYIFIEYVCVHSIRL